MNGACQLSPFPRSPPVLGGSIDPHPPSVENPTPPWVSSVKPQCRGTGASSTTRPQCDQRRQAVGSSRVSNGLRTRRRAMHLVGCTAPVSPWPSRARKVTMAPDWCPRHRSSECWGTRRWENFLLHGSAAPCPPLQWACARRPTGVATAYAQPLSPWRQAPASTAVGTDSNRPQPFRQPPPTANRFWGPLRGPLRTIGGRC